MSVPGNLLDASFFSLMHGMCAQYQESKDSGDRRARERHAFHVRQRVALTDAPGIPDESQFVEVQCRDLSQRGFSFLRSIRPSCETLVVAFGRPPDVIYVRARIAHVNEVFVYPAGTKPEGDPSEVALETDAKEMFLVGCEFVERLQA